MVAYIPETLNFDYSMTPIDFWKMMTALRGLTSRNRKEFEGYLKEEATRQSVIIPKTTND